MNQNLIKTTYGIFLTSESGKIIKRLEASGTNYIGFPAVSIEQVTLDEAGIKLLKNIKRFDWLIFFEPVSIEFFLENMAANGVDLYELDDLKICVLSELCSDKLRFQQIHTDIIFTAKDNIFQLIEKYSINESSSNPQKILIIGKFNETSKLKHLKNSFEIEKISVFQSSVSKEANFVKYKTLLNGGAVDEFILTTPADLISIKKYISDDLEINQIRELKFSSSDVNLIQFFIDNGLTVVINKRD